MNKLETLVKNGTSGSLAYNANLKDLLERLESSEIYKKLGPQFENDEVIAIKAEDKTTNTGSASGSGNLTEASAIATSSAATDSSKSVEASSEFLHNMQPQPSAPEEPVFHLHMKKQYLPI